MQLDDQRMVDAEALGVVTRFSACLQAARSVSARLVQVGAIVWREEQ
jgi:hypothetical protein